MCNISLICLLYVGALFVNIECKDDEEAAAAAQEKAKSTDSREARSHQEES